MKRMFYVSLVFGGLVMVILFSNGNYFWVAPAGVAMMVVGVVKLFPRI